MSKPKLVTVAFTKKEHAYLVAELITRIAVNTETLEFLDGVADKDMVKSVHEVLKYQRSLLNKLAPLPAPQRKHRNARNTATLR